MRQAFREKISQIDRRRLVFVDESAFYTTMTRRYGRAPRGKRVVEKVPSKRGKRTSLISAITAWGVEAWMTLQANVTSSVFVSWLQKHLLPVLSVGSIVVMDNLRVHKHPEVQKVIESVGAEVWYQPAYSPDFNPMEPGYSKIKSFVRKKKPRTQEELNQAIKEGANAITPDDAYGYFNVCNAGYHVN